MFNPRVEKWSDYFGLDGGSIVGLNHQGWVTVHILQFNLPERILEREKLIAVGEYPPPYPQTT